VALKILARDASRHELNVLRRITAASHGTSEQIINFLDHFEQLGDEGTHLCLVLEIMWQDAMSFCRGFSPEDRLLLVRQISGYLLQGLESLQTWGIIHNGKTSHLYRSLF
jgi:hypothetical protein